MKHFCITNIRILCLTFLVARCFSLCVYPGRWTKTFLVQILKAIEQIVQNLRKTNISGTPMAQRAAKRTPYPYWKAKEIDFFMAVMASGIPLMGA